MSPARRLSALLVAISLCLATGAAAERRVERARGPNGATLATNLRLLRASYGRPHDSAARVLRAAAAAPSPPSPALLEETRAALFAERAWKSRGRYTWAGVSGPDPRQGYRTAEVSSTPLAGGGEKQMPNDFARWVHRHGGKPDAFTGKMNCWQAVMYTAYRAGLVSYDRLVQIHEQAEQAARTAQNPVQYVFVLAKSLDYGRSAPLGPGSEPRAGDIVFFNGVTHVAISLGTRDARGRHEIMSLWQYPTQRMARTTIEELSTVRLAAGSLAPVRFAPAPW